MAKRKTITKKLRFEVFKRDGFKCQYCGRSAPDVVLQVDHITPVSKGGTNDLTNLITSCVECNQGKKATTLSDASIVEKQRKQLSELNERREQLKMMAKWREELLNMEEEKLQIARKHWESSVQGYTLNESGLANLRKWLKRFPLEVILESIDASVAQYLEMGEKGYTHASVEKSFAYIPKICRVKIAGEDKPYLEQLLYIRGILRNRLCYCDLPAALSYLEAAYKKGFSLDELAFVAREVTSWTEFKDTISDMLNMPDPDEV